MPRLLVVAGAFGVGAMAIAAAQSATSGLNVKPGLWEVTSISLTTGALPVPAEALAKLTPEQREHMEKLMAGAGIRSQAPHNFRICITEAEVKRGPDFSEHRGNCTQTVLSSSSTELKVRLECKGRATTTGTIDYSTPDPQTMTGEFDMAVTNGGTMTVRGHMQGKWLSADCGGVKPNLPD